MIGANNLDCGMPDMDTTCESTDTANAVQPIPCCENHYTTVSVKDGFTSSSLITVPNVIFIQAFVTTFIDFLFVRESLTDDFFTYLPPIPRQNITILYQVFRL